MAVNGDSNLEAVNEFSKNEVVERAATEETATKVVSDREVINEAVGGDPLVETVTGAAGGADAADSNAEIDDTF